MISQRTWRSFAEVADLLDGPADPDWDSDRDRIDPYVRHPDSPLGDTPS